MTKEIIIIGASDVFDLVQMAHGPSGGRVIGYCGLEEIKCSRYVDFPWLGSDVIAAHHAHPGVAFVFALSSNARRRFYTAELKAIGGEVLSAIHPQTVIFPSAQLGNGVIIQPFCTVSTKARVEDGVYLNYGSLVGHDVRVGAYSFIAPGAQLLGEVDVGEDVAIGTNAVVFPQVKVGDGARIGAGVVVNRDVPAGASVISKERPRVLGGSI